MTVVSRTTVAGVVTGVVALLGLAIAAAMTSGNSQPPRHTRAFDAVAVSGTISDAVVVYAETTEDPVLVVRGADAVDLLAGPSSLTNVSAVVITVTAQAPDTAACQITVDGVVADTAAADGRAVCIWLLPKSQMPASAPAMPAFRND